MTSILASLVEPPVVGNDPGWLLSFRPEREGRVDESAKPFEIGAEEYEAEITASMPAGLEGGTYTFAIEGMSDADYARVAQGKLRSVKLYLYWRDLPGILGAASSVTSVLDPLRRFATRGTDDRLVADLRVESVSRKLGARRYVTTIKARERVHDVCATTPVCDPIDAPLAGALDKLLSGRVEYELHATSGATPAAAPSASAPKNITVLRGDSIAKALAAIGDQLEQTSGSYGRGMFLIQTGKLHVGVRPIPLPSRKEVELTPRTGLVQVEALDPLVTDPSLDPCDHPEGSPTRRQFRLIMRGRPDIRPGDVVTVVPPDEEEAPTSSPLGVLGAAIEMVAGPVQALIGGGKAARLYAASVEHRQGRTSSFVTTVTAVEITSGKEWDVRERPRSSIATKPNDHASPEAHAAQAVKQAVAAALDARAGTSIAEVRSTTTKGQGPPSSQTETLWRGLESGDGKPRQSGRLAIERPSGAPAKGVPYATPFAWGKCGLVLPRYPGTRVVVTHADGLAEEPIDVGALWESGKGPDSEAGDWWLILPVEASNPQSASGDAAPPAHTGNVTNDLIDANGNRVIEVGELTIRVGPNSLNSAGSRPARGSNVITIENADKSAHVAIDEDGTITLHAAQDIVLEAPSGAIKLDAQSVDVKVSATMDVHG